MTETTLTVRTERSIDIVDITGQVEGAISMDYTGAVVLTTMHTTAALLINEAESRLLDDIETMLTSVIGDGPYEHDQIDDNAAAHLRASLLDASVVIPVDGGSLSLGTWQAVLLVDCDGPRTRTLRVTPL